MPDLPVWEWIAIISGIIGTIGAFWDYTKRAIQFLFRPFIDTKYVDPSLGEMIISHLKKNRVLQPSKWYFYKTMFVRSLGRQQKVIVRNIAAFDAVLFYKNWPIFTNSSDDDTRDSRAFSFFRWTVDWHKLLFEATFSDEEEGRSSFRFLKVYGNGSGRGGDNNDDECVPVSTNSRKSHRLDDDLEGYVPIHYSIEDLGPSREQASLDQLSLSAELLDLVDELRFIKSAREWFRERCIVWRRSYGFVGEPGVGKSSMSRSIAEDLDLPLVSFDLASLTNATLQQAWAEYLAKYAPCIFLFEDIDTVFGVGDDLRKSQVKGLTFDCYANLLDGVERHDGLITIITTNHPNRLDPALKRKGRMDRIIEFHPIDFNGKVKLGMRILRDEALVRELAQTHLSANASDFNEICCQTAISNILKSRKLSR